MEPSQKAQEKPTALIVDDDQINRLILEKMLGILGFSTVSVSSGKAALSAVKKTIFDLIFLDIQMPDMDGYETAKAIRLTDGSASTPMIAVTANALEQDRIKAQESGMVGFITKPINLQVVQQTIEQCSGNHHVPTRQPKDESKSDIDSFLTKLGGELKFARTMIDRMEVNAVALIQEMQQEASASQPIRLPGLRHKLKGLLAAVNATQAFDLLEGLPRIENKPEQEVFLQNLEHLENAVHHYAQQVRIAIQDQGQ